ncbi:hypothetical protein [Endozoicomonas sp. SCSIO W0465]|uniref:hypothetical protein n=1 Tax=Endozoicomonas sp. SCSIO W0465 TaxID=2918516 RepID=UPI0020753EBD|nr:hypothetical protein [Endozoicomonas sp. SCSIO W0465]USE37692.1 hypothetical protein MJO57_05685 [Endozoicomonas sp. SCSIO W0465]
MDKDNAEKSANERGDQKNSVANKRRIISQQDVNRTLLSSAGFPRVEVKPLAERMVSQQPDNLEEALAPLAEGVNYAADLIHRLQDAHPSLQQEKQQHADRINDTIHLLEGLQKALDKETKDRFNGHNNAEIGQQEVTSENHALYRESSTLLNTLQSYIRTLEKMRSATAR